MTMTLARELGQISLAHLTRLTDDVGIIQHATLDVPNRETGYCTDDVARAFMVAIDANRADMSGASRLEIIYASFLAHAQLEGGNFHNFMSYGRQWLDDIGDGDAIGRAIWALGYGERFALEGRLRQFCRRLFDQTMTGAIDMVSIHSLAFRAIGVSHAYSAREDREGALRAMLTTIGERLTLALRNEAQPGWHWFEPQLTYDSARQPEALLRVGSLLGRPDYITSALAALEFYVSVVFEDGVFTPVGSAGWYRRGEPKARFPQQPLEAAALIDAAALAHEITGELRYRELARTAFAWFSGTNIVGRSLISNGGCADGIDHHGLSENMGAESTLAYLAASFAMQRLAARP